MKNKDIEKKLDSMRKVLLMLGVVLLLLTGIMWYNNLKIENHKVIIKEEKQDKYEIVTKYLKEITDCYIVSNYTEETNIQGTTTGHYEESQIIEDCNVEVIEWNDNTTTLMMIK